MTGGEVVAAEQGEADPAVVAEHSSPLLPGAEREGSTGADSEPVNTDPGAPAAAAAELSARQRAREGLGTSGSAYRSELAAHESEHQTRIPGAVSDVQELPTYVELAAGRQHEAHHLRLLGASPINHGNEVRDRQRTGPQNSLRSDAIVKPGNEHVVVSALNPDAWDFVPGRAPNAGVPRAQGRSAPALMYPALSSHQHLQLRPHAQPAPFVLDPSASVFEPRLNRAQLLPRAQGRYGEPAPALMYPALNSYQHLHLRPHAQHFVLDPRASVFEPRLNRAQLLPRAQGRHGEEPAPSPFYQRGSSSSRAPPQVNLSFNRWALPLGVGGHHQFDAVPHRQIRSVWRHNWDDEMQYLSFLLKQGRPALVGFDSEYAAPAPTPEYIGPPLGADEWYARTSSLVNSGDLVQIAFALQFEDMEPSVHIFEINMFFDPEERIYNPVTLQFLRDAGHLLELHTSHGIALGTVAGWIASNLQNLISATWVVFQGDNDLGFFLRSFGLEPFLLPAKRLDFLQRLSLTFPRYYDVRVLGLHLLGWDQRGFKLEKLGTSMGIERLGCSHGSGSDALLTLDCFVEIRRRLGEKINPLIGVLCGLYCTEDLVRSALPVYAQNLKQLEVGKGKFYEHAAFVLNSVDSDFTIIGLHVVLGSDLQYEICMDDDEYKSLRNSLDSALTAIVCIAIGRRQGQLAGGQFCRFHICFDDEPRHLKNGDEYIPSKSFYKFLLSHLLGNENINWVTFHGAEQIACIYRTAKALPPFADQYLESRTRMFPCLYDLVIISEDDEITLPKLCRRCSVLLEKSTGQQENVAVLIVRCFLHIIGSAQDEDLERSSGILSQNPKYKTPNLNEDGSKKASFRRTLCIEPVKTTSDAKD